MNAILTQHAIERAEQRTGLRKDSLQRLADAALRGGISHMDARGKLRRYMDSLFLSEHNGTNNRIYGEHAFIFAETKLITVLPLPNRMKPLVAKLRERKVAS